MELVKLSNLARIPGVKGIRARLYHDAGVDAVTGGNNTPEEAMVRDQRQAEGH